MRLKIVSDGTHGGTYLSDAETGERVPGVLGITWSTDPQGEGRPPLASITMRGVEIDAVADAGVAR